MKMLGARQTANPKLTPYATHADFCQIFQKEMNHLYLLSFLLTADHPTAERCFVGGLEDCAKGNPVFRQWARSWARRTVIQNAIRVIGPRPVDGKIPDSASGHGASHPVTAPAKIAAIVELPAFERFAFVMSVLERYSDLECSLLLDCTRGNVVAARTRALKQMGNSVELGRGLVSIGTDRQKRDDDPGSILGLETISHLAASA